MTDLSTEEKALIIKEILEEEEEEVEDSLWNLQYWGSREWEIVQEKLNGQTYNPGRENLFKSMETVDLDLVRVAILGQDPYPERKHCTGIAFSIPPNVNPFPPTLNTIFTEYCSDLDKLWPTSGDLTPWCKQGVFLWNVIPSCQTGKSLSHNWDEWKFLTIEIIQTLALQGCVFALLGSKAHAFQVHVPEFSVARLFSHPSPRASRHSKHPFLGSRPFTTINADLVKMKKEPIDWSLP